MPHLESSSVRGLFGALAALAILVSAPNPAEACAPGQLVRVVYRNVSPGLAASDPAAQPRILWRIASTFLRSEEQPDPASGVQTLVIVSEPDLWVINLTDRTGRHAIDPDPSQIVRAPIVPMPDAPPIFQSLEFGCEADFVRANAPAPQSRTKWGDGPAQLHVLTQGEHSLAILMDSRRNTPLLISYLRQGRPVLVVRYDDHRTGVPAREDLFRPPGFVKLQEAPASAVISR